MGQRELALQAANEVFQDDLKNIFQTLSFALSTDPTAPDVQEAIEKAKNGIRLSQSALQKCKDLAQALPQN